MEKIHEDSQICKKYFSIHPFSFLLKFSQFSFWNFIFILKIYFIYFPMSRFEIV